MLRRLDTPSLLFSPVGGIHPFIFSLSISVVVGRGRSIHYIPSSNNSSILTKSSIRTPPTPTRLQHSTARAATLRRWRMVAIYYIAIVVSDVVVIVVVRAGATTSPFLLSQLVIVSQHSYTRSEKIETKRDAFGNTTTNHGAEDVDGGQ